MKKILAPLMIALCLPGPAIGAEPRNSLERADVYRDVLRLRHVVGKKDEASLLASQLVSSSRGDQKMQDALKNEIADLEKAGEAFPMEKAIRFATGRKREVYCKGVGLVEVTGQHNDGSTSRVVLLANNRKIDQESYSHVFGGDWVYEMRNGHRPNALTSDVWALSGSTSSFHVKEVRSLPNGKFDQGDYKASWSAGSISNSFSSQGEVKEPLPIFMALDYHLWGNRDLGFRIRFQPGARGSTRTREQGAAKTIVLDSEHVVGEPLATYEVKRSQGQVNRYSDCFPVDYEIKLHSTETPQQSSKSQLDHFAVVAVFKQNLSKTRACFERMLTRDPLLRGEITIELLIDDKGRVTKVREASRSIVGNLGSNGGNELMKCLGKEISRWTFPAAKPGETVLVKYPLTFSP